MEETVIVLNKCMKTLTLRVVSAKLSASFLVKLWTIPFFPTATNAPHPFLNVSCFSRATDHSIISQGM